MIAMFIIKLLLVVFMIIMALNENFVNTSILGAVIMALSGHPIIAMLFLAFALVFYLWENKK